MKPSEKKALAIEIFKEVAKTLCKTNEHILDSIDRLEKGMLERGWIILEECPLCLSPIDYIDLQGGFRAKCDCTNVNGDNKNDSYCKWVDKIYSEVK
jgi:hypothetical protein